MIYYILYIIYIYIYIYYILSMIYIISIIYYIYYIHIKYVFSGFSKNAIIYFLICSRKQTITQNLINTVQITNYNTKHSQNTELYFQESNFFKHLNFCFVLCIRSIIHISIIFISLYFCILYFYIFIYIYIINY